MRFLSDLVLSVALGIIAAGCDSNASNTNAQTAEAGSVAVDGASQDVRPNATPQTFSIIADFEMPESVLHDPIDDVYLVSNMGLGPNPIFDKDDNGFISRIAPDGTVLDLRWIDGVAGDVTLHGPFGMALVDDVLHVVDRDAVRQFDRQTGSPLGSVGLAQEHDVSLLNDICIGPTGTLYVTDTGLAPDENGDLGPSGTDAIYAIFGGDVSVLAAGPHLEGPNGCTVNGQNLFWTTFKSNKSYRLNASGEPKLVAELSKGSIDGIVQFGGAIYFSSWEGDGSVLMTNASGKRETLVATVQTPGDLGFDAARGRLLVPSVFGGYVLVVSIGE